MFVFKTLDGVYFKIDEEYVRVIEYEPCSITFEYFGLYDVYKVYDDYILQWTGDDIFAKYRIDEEAYRRVLEFGINRTLKTEDPC